MLEGLRRVLESDFIIVATAKDGYELLRLALLHKPDAIVSDLSMPGLTGLDVLQRIRAAKLRTKFIILTMHSDADIARDACQKGASGFVLKTSAASQLEPAIRTALDGGVYIDPVLAPNGALNFVRGQPWHPNTVGQPDRSRTRGSQTGCGGTQCLKRFQDC